jgi:flagellar protein FlgJ
MTAGGSVSFDPQALTALRLDARARGHSPETLRKVASQFEALFTQTMLKSARAARLGDGLFESGGHDHYLEMFDAQIALKLAQGRGLGLAEMLAKQLSRGAPAAAAPAAAQTHRGEGGPLKGAPDTARHFTRMLWPHAERAGRELGVDPEAIVAQAALESGWGRATLRHPDGRNSFNVFGIKATPDWSGARVSVPTLEYEDGVAVRQRAEFRSYGSYGEAFSDYARLIKTRPRYRAALGAGGGEAFAEALARAGYATDPAYAQKIRAVLDGAPLREALADVRGRTPVAGGKALGARALKFPGVEPIA